MTTGNGRWGTGPVLAAAAAAFLAFPPGAGAVGDAYLAAVRAEMAEVNGGAFAVPPGSPWVRADTEQARLNTASPEYKAFDQLLRAKMPGTYIQFQRIDPARQLQLFQAYVVDGDLDRVRRSVLETLKK